MQNPTSQENHLNQENSRDKPETKNGVDKKNVDVQIIYALPHKQYLFDITVDSATTVKNAILKSPILIFCPDINIDEAKVGVFSRIVKLDDVVKQGDRIEIYRPLIADPKELRRMRAKRAEDSESK